MASSTTIAGISAISLLVTGPVVHAEIAIGVVGPMSGSFALLGAQMVAGAEQAIVDINARGGVRGEQLVLEVGDDRCDRKQAETVANQMVGRGVALVVGHLCSGPSLVAAPIYRDAGIIQISPGARAAAYTDERAGPGTFRLTGRDDRQGPLTGAFLAERFPDQRIAIVYDDTPYGTKLAEATLKAMNEAGKDEELYEAHPATDRNFGPLISRIVAERIDVLYFAGDHAEAALLVRRLRDDGADVQLVAGDTLMTEEFIEIAGDAGEGALMTYPPDPARNDAAAGVVESFARRDVIAEGYILPSYAAVEVWAAAANAAETAEFDAVAATLGAQTYDTVIGSVAFDEQGDATLPSYVVYEWRDGEYDYAPM
jgi:branched-chain amino acid transport system substrate-binding protein